MISSRNIVDRRYDTLEEVRRQHIDEDILVDIVILFGWLVNKSITI